jgi:xanthine dehydrogenase YagR molybdenum-binding subunit
MKFDTPAGQNPIDQLKVVGKPLDRIDGKFKTTGTAPYANDWHDPQAKLAYGSVVGATIAKGRIRSMDLAQAKAAPGVLAIVTAETAGTLGKAKLNTAKLLGGPRIEHYHQAVAVVVAETFEQARAAAAHDVARTPASGISPPPSARQRIMWTRRTSPPTTPTR